MRADVTFGGDGRVSGFRFRVDTLLVSIGTGNFLTITARDFDLNTGATGNERVVSFGSVGAQVKVGTLQIGGEARNFGFTADGSFKTGNPSVPGSKFSVVLQVGGAGAGQLGWPEWLPVKITALGVEFNAPETNLLDFNIILSA